MINPYFDPVHRGYQEFYKLLTAISRPDDPPNIEIHLCHLDQISKQQYEDDFRRRLSNLIQAESLQVEVFIWDYFHDRFIISNLTGIQLGHSLSISDHPSEETTWTRIGSSRRDELQTNFSRN